MPCAVDEDCGVNSHWTGFWVSQHINVLELQVVVLGITVVSASTGYPLQLPGYSGRLTPLTDSLIAGMVAAIRPVCVGHSELSDADSSLVSQFLRGAQRLTVCRPGYPVPPSSLAPFSVLILNHHVGLEGSVSSMLCWAIGIAVGGCRTGKG